MSPIAFGNAATKFIQMDTHVEQRLRTPARPTRVESLANEQAIERLL